MSWTSGQFLNESTVNSTKKLVNIKQTRPILSQNYMKYHRQPDFKPKLLLKSMNNSSMSWNSPKTWPKLEQYYLEQMNKANAWQSLGSFMPNIKKELQKTILLTHSTSPLVSNTKYLKKKVIKPLMPLVMNLCKTSQQLDLNKNSFNNNSIAKEKNIITMITMGKTKEVTEDKENRIFLGAGVTTTLTPTSRTTSTIKTTIKTTHHG